MPGPDKSPANPLPERISSWEWLLPASPDKLWPLVSDTDRFNRDTGLPPLAAVETVPGGRVRKLTVSKWGLSLSWTEDPFEWESPSRFAVTRRFLAGPLAEMRVALWLEAAGYGSRLHYRVGLRPRNAFWAAFLPLAGALIHLRFGAVFRRYGQAAARAVAPEAAAPVPVLPEAKSFAPGGKERLAARFQDLLAAGADPLLAARLRLLLEDAGDSALMRMRPYALARDWDAARRPVLETFLLGARTGLLAFRWDVLCPFCRGAKAVSTQLRDVRSLVHCDACNVDFRAGFDRSVEVTFGPNPALREAAAGEYCVGGPQRTPHVVLQRRLPPGQAAFADLALEPGRYRLRCPDLPGGLHVRAESGGESEPLAEPLQGEWPRGEFAWGTHARVTLANPRPLPALYILERFAWADDAVTAAEVTALQSFRDLFAEEALRPGEEISVGSMAFLFTDLRGSTRLYREVGDAKAFGLVMEHFDILKAAVAAEGGAVVKTIGDAVMAVFPRPQAALRAALAAHRGLGEALEPLVLKAGVHCGPCIAVNQNDRLDYFGSTLNLAARLLGFCAGGDVVISAEAAADPETARWLSEGDARVEDMHVNIRGFEQEAFRLKRIIPGAIPTASHA